MRRRVTSGSNLEPEIGFSRAVRRGNLIAISGTASIWEGARTVGVGDVYSQTKHCLAIVKAALIEVDSCFEDVIRTRVMLTNVTTWREAARAHGEAFGDIRPACTFVEVSRFIHPEWLVEIEVDAVTAE